MGVAKVLLLQIAIGCLLSVSCNYRICWYPCFTLLRHIDPYCGVDPVRGVKVFRNRCYIRRNNYCYNTNFTAMKIPECFKKYPYARKDYIEGILRTF